MRVRHTATWLSLYLIAAALATGLAPRPQDPTAPFPRHGEYLGKAVCKDCHEDQWEVLAASVHAGVLAVDGLRGCETCHGPGQAHGDHEDNEPRLITHPQKLPAKVQGAVCQQCHADQMAVHGGDPEGFAQAGKGCTDCHTVHEEPGAVPHEGLGFERRALLDRSAEPVGAATCLQCHPRRDELLAHGGHASLRAGRDAQGCESCHGNGSLHVETGGLARLITRPDHAADGAVTCRECHAGVDPVDFHWREGDKPLLSDGLTCTSCHTVHREPTAPERAGGFDPQSVAPRSPDQQRLDQQTGEYRAPAATNRLCAQCHAPAFEVLHGTIHASLGGLDLPLAQGCGGCHDNAEAHARSGGVARLVDSLRDTSGAHQLQACGRCHDDTPHLAHVRLGAHQRHEVTCLTCHSPAAPAGQTRRQAEERCTKCHTDVAAEFHKPNHHPVPEGHMACSDCHNPHSARPKLRDRALRTESCVRCHTEYRGPFVFAHQASRSDGCTICHAPHGSTNQRMLTHHRTQQLCLQCHADFPSFHDQTSGAVFTNCLQCHTEVHGSNHSRFLFR